MKIDYTGRHVEVTPALREFAEEKLRKLEKLLDGPLDIHVVLSIEKHRHTAEIQVKARQAVFTGTRETDDLYASIGEVADKLERQALKHKEKVQHHKQRRGPRDPVVAAVIGANAAPAEAGQDNGESAPAAVPRIVRTQNFRLKPMAPEDAAIELESSGEPLLVFRDSQSGKMNVIHRDGNGDFRLVEPDF